jgi:hypothetical protein
LVVEYFSRICKVLGLIPSISKTNEPTNKNLATLKEEKKKEHGREVKK